MGKYIVEESKAGFRFNLVAGNGQVIGTSEIYANKAGCKGGLESVRRNGPAAALEDQTAADFAAAVCPKFEVYTDKKGEYRFRLKARNGEIILSSEGYVRKDSCLNGVESVRKNADSPIEEK